MTPEDWIAHDPDPVTAAELARCDGAELTARFARPLSFGTAGLRGPVRGGPDAMNLAVVLRASWAVAKVLTGRGLTGSGVIVGRDARHGSAAFATATAEVLCRRGVFGDFAAEAGTYPGARVRGPAHRRGGRHPDHGVTQSAG